VLRHGLHTGFCYLITGLSTYVQSNDNNWLIHKCITHSVVTDCQ